MVNMLLNIHLQNLFNEEMSLTAVIIGEKHIVQKGSMMSSGFTPIRF